MGLGVIGRGLVSAVSGFASNRPTKCEGAKLFWFWMRIMAFDNKVAVVAEYIPLLRIGAAP